ncbi:MAG: hypothetical protein AAF692_06085 [Pseudomonadota bacterium]
MSKIHKLSVAAIAMTAASPAFAHEADFFHTHGEGLMWAAGIAVVGGVALRYALKIARK